MPLSSIMFSNDSQPIFAVGPNVTLKKKRHSGSMTRKKTPEVFLACYTPTFWYGSLHEVQIVQEKAILPILTKPARPNQSSPAQSSPVSPVQSDRANSSLTQSIQSSSIWSSQSSSAQLCQSSQSSLFKSNLIQTKAIQSRQQSRQTRSIQSSQPRDIPVQPVQTNLIHIQFNSYN